MKYETTAKFQSDYRTLSDRDRSLFRSAVKLINAAYAKHLKSQGAGLPVWPTRLRLKPVTDAPGIFEMTWSFTGPDGRATFEFFRAGAETGIRWRRIGDHKVIRIDRA